MAWSDRHARYLDACRRIAPLLEADPDAPFKTDPDYASVVGNDTRSLGQTSAFVKWHRQRRSAEELAALVSVNDLRGEPRHQPSLASLRYLQVADELGWALPVLEIGGGYGGQRLFFSCVNDYTIIDVPEALAVQRAYLKPTGLPTRFVEAGSSVSLSLNTVVLSDYALTELSPKVITRYLEDTISQALAIRVTGSEGQSKFFQQALPRFFSNVTVNPEEPPSSKHPNVVIWGNTPTGGALPTPSPADTEARLRAAFQAKTPISFSRWGDGEWSAILYRGTANCDGQAYTPELRMGLAAVLHARPSYLLGLQPLAVRRFGPAIATWLTRSALWPSWGHADVWVRLSTRGWLQAFVEPLRARPVLMVGPAHLQGIFPTVGHVVVPDVNAVADLPRLQAEIRAAIPLLGPDGVVAVSAGMGAKILIHEGVQHAPHLSWLDFGSVWEPYVGRANRRYHAEILARLS